MSSLKSTSSSRGADQFDQTVSPEGAGFRLDQTLGGMPGIVSREMARRLILEGAVFLNGKSCEPSKRVKQGDIVSYRLPPPQTSAISAEKGPLDILHEDRSLVVINKPPGLSMHPGPGHRRGTLVNLLLGHCSDLSGIGGSLRPGIVHRLDMDTSGVVVAAKHDAAHQHLAAQFKAHSAHRIYLALTVGKPKGNRGKIETLLERDPGHRLKRAVRDSGKRAVTHWELARGLGRFALLRLRLETGRTHQIRVHLAHLDCPVLGDPLYGKGRHRGLSLPPALATALDVMKRQALHAFELGFVHPDTGKELRFTAPIPGDMQAAIDAIDAVEKSLG